jgi:hypothetical protein
MLTETELRESVVWTAAGLTLEVRDTLKDRFFVTVRHVGSAPVLWDGDCLKRGRTLDELPDTDFTLEVLGRVVRDQADRMDRLVYAQDEWGEAFRTLLAAVPGPYRS